MDWDGKCYLFHVPSIYPGKKTEVKSILITKDVKTRVREGYTGAENGMCFSWRNKGWRDAVFIYNIPESFKAFCNIVSLMAANTRRILEVSVACVKLNKLFFFFFSNQKKDQENCQLYKSRVIPYCSRLSSLTVDKYSTWPGSLD